MVKRIEIPEHELDFIVELTSTVSARCPCGEEVEIEPDGNPEPCPNCGRHFWAVITVKAWREDEEPR